MTLPLRRKLSFHAFLTMAARFHTGVKQYKLQSILPMSGFHRYVWVDGTAKKGVAAVFDKNRNISSILFTPLTTYPKTDSQFTNTTFVLPFRGRWFTTMGGPHVLVNYHYAYPHKRYAFDFVKIRNDKMFSGHPYRNESYFAFGQKILAPAPGEVVKVENSIPDNSRVGKRNLAHPAGNYVVIDHGNGEYSILAHLKYQSVRVQVGDLVKQGDVIGLCGNSGNSQGPHLHFQVSNSPDYQSAESIRIRFQGIPEPFQGRFVTAP